MFDEAAHDSRAMALGDAAATHALGVRLGALLLAGDVVGLSGALGAGKTSLARGAVAAWMGAPCETPSPTFTIMQTYESARGVLTHMDLYRLRSEAEVEEAGVIEAMHGGPCLIEWPDRLGAWAPHNRLDILIEADGAGRRAWLTPFGSWRERLVTI